MKIIIISLFCRAGFEMTKFINRKEKVSIKSIFLNFLFCWNAEFWLHSQIHISKN